MTTISFSEYLARMPLLHRWEESAPPNTGGFESTHLAKLRTFFEHNLPNRASIIETGAGNTTIFFLMLSPQSLVTIDPSLGTHSVVTAYCSKHEIDMSALEAIVARSEDTLPRLAEARAGTFDFALIDGDHSWPAVFVDFHFMNRLLRRGGYFMIDDVQLHSVGELVRFLLEEPGFKKVLDLGKALVFEKTDDAAYPRGWMTQPYIRKKYEAAR
jgi:predicted O-methyltransferase YrrM